MVKGESLNRGTLVVNICEFAVLVQTVNSTYWAVVPSHSQVDTFIRKSNLLYWIHYKTSKFLCCLLSANIEENYFTWAQTNTKHQTIRVELNGCHGGTRIHKHEQLLLLNIMQTPWAITWADSKVAATRVHCNAWNLVVTSHYIFNFAGLVVDNDSLFAGNDNIVRVRNDLALALGLNLADYFSRGDFNELLMVVGERK